MAGSYSFRWCFVTFAGGEGYRVREGVGTNYECDRPWNHPRQRAGVDRHFVTFNSAHDDLRAMTGDQIVEHITDVIAPALVECFDCTCGDLGDNDPTCPVHGDDIAAGR